MRRIDGEAQAALELFVGADRAERSALGEGTSEREIEVGDWHGA
jgi:hypothetical protein